MQLTDLDNREADLIARGLFAIASVDGMHCREAQFVCAWLYRGEAGGDDAWFDKIKQSPITVDALAEGLSQIEHRKLFLQLARSLAYADGVISAGEQGVIDRYIDAFGIAEGDIGDEGMGLIATGHDHPLRSPLSEATRKQAATIYRAYLDERDGEIDVGARLLSKREKWFQEIEANPVRWLQPLDVETFERNLEKFVDRDLDPLMLFLLIALKTNRIEAYAADLAESSGKIDRAGADSPDAYINTEEIYHTRVLQNIAHCFGIDIDMGSPTLTQRLLVRSMLKLPRDTTLPTILAGELMATVCFRLLMEKAETLLAAQPEVRDRVVLLLREIMTDELGHVAYCRSKLGPLGIRMAHLLSPVVVTGMLRDLPEVAALLGDGVIQEELAKFNIEDIRSLCTVSPFWTEAAPETAGEVG